MLLGILDGVVHRVAAADERRWLVALGLISLAPRVASALLLSTVPTGDFSWYDQRVVGLAADLGYQQDGVPTSFWPPGWPFALSLVYRLFGQSWLAGMLLKALLGVAICLLTYLVARRLVGLVQARVAGLLVAIFSSQILFTNLLGTEVLFTVLLLLVLHLLLRRPVPEQGYAYVALIGATLGLTAFVKTLALLLPLLIFVWWLLAGTGLRRAVARLAVMILCSLVVVLPWTARTLAQLGTPILLSTGGGPNLWIGNNPGAP